MKQTAIGSQVYIIDKYFKIFFKNSLKEFDLNSTEGMVMLMLYDQENKKNKKINSGTNSPICGSTQEQIINQLHYDKAAMTRTMQSLEKKLYLERILNPNDNRSYIFTLTEKGLAFKPSLIRILKFWNDALLEDIMPEDIEKISGILKLMSENALKITNKRNE